MNPMSRRPLRSTHAVHEAMRDGCNNKRPYVAPRKTWLQRLVAFLTQDMGA